MSSQAPDNQSLSFMSSESKKHLKLLTYLKMRVSSGSIVKLDNSQTESLLRKDRSEQQGPTPRLRKGLDCLTVALVALLISLLVNVMSLASIFRQSRDDFPKYFYSPVHDILTFHPRLFTTGLGNDTTVYQGPPSASKQAAWNALYRKSLRVPRHIAIRLNNKTVPLPQHEHSKSSDEEFGIGLMVFHNLHCLHSISEVLDVFHYPSHYGLNASFNPYDGVHTKVDFTTQPSLPFAFLDSLHLEHCIDLLRQALMCNADITPYVFQQAEVGSEVVGTRVDTVHMCADFHALKDWAIGREFDGDFRGTDILKAVGRCSADVPGCGEEFGDSLWRSQNKWTNLEPWAVQN